MKSGINNIIKRKSEVGQKRRQTIDSNFGSFSFQRFTFTICALICPCDDRILEDEFYETILLGNYL